MQMEHHQKQINQHSEDLPIVLVLNPPSPIFVLFEEKFISTKYKLLKIPESTPLDQFLTNHKEPIRAILCYGKVPVTRDIIHSLLPSLQVIATASAGFNNIDLSECRRVGIAVVNAGDVFVDDGADAAVGLLIDVFRNVSAGDRFVRDGLWPLKGDYHLGSKLGGKRVGIVGLGGFGSAIAKRLVVFGCKILYNSRKPKPNVSYPFFDNVYDLATHSDALIICCALNDETRYMINRKVMLALGKKGVILNIARGAIINEKEMVECLVKGELGGAGLDAFEDEPNVPEELLGLDNVVLSPHKVAFTAESFVACAELMVRNLEAFFSNKPLLTPVTLGDD